MKLALLQIAAILLAVGFFDFFAVLGGDDVVGAFSDRFEHDRPGCGGTGKLTGVVAQAEGMAKLVSRNVDMIGLIAVPCDVRTKKHIVPAWNPTGFSSSIRCVRHLNTRRIVTRTVATLDLYPGNSRVDPKITGRWAAFRGLPEIVGFLDHATKLVVDRVELAPFRNVDGRFVPASLILWSRVLKAAGARRGQLLASSPTRTFFDQPIHLAALTERRL
ncbi:MAG: hypothetical protein SX243_22160 [Acidobacteriota bacterium]|nr:hypothetical protein [Acidobacteriota bacterium]